MDFFNEISLLYGTITEFCTPSTCPVMSAGPQYEYLWADGVKVKKPIKVSAPEYVDLLMSWVETQLNDEHIFPLQLGNSHTLPPLPTQQTLVPFAVLILRVFLLLVALQIDRSVGLFGGCVAVCCK